MELEVRDPDPALVEGADDVGELLAAVVEPHRGGVWLAGDELAEGLEELGRAGALALIGGGDLDRRPADLGLERRGRALGGDLAAVDDPDPVRELVGLLQVLGGEEDGDALVAGEVGDLVPERRPALDVEAGGRLVEEEDPGAGGGGPAPGRGAASSRRSSRATLRSAASVRPTRSSSSSPRRVRSCFDIPWSAPWRRMCSLALSCGSRAASWRAAPIASRTRAPSVATSWPATRGAAGGGGQQGGEHVDGGRLAGAVGAEEAVDLAGSNLEVDPVDRLDAALELADEAVRLDPVVASGPGRSPWFRSGSQSSAPTTSVCFALEVVANADGSVAQ